MAQYIEPYKKFKMMYTVDVTGDLKGKFAHYKQALWSSCELLRQRNIELYGNELLSDENLNVEQLKS